MLQSRVTMPLPDQLFSSGAFSNATRHNAYPATYEEAAKGRADVHRASGVWKDVWRILAEGETAKVPYAAVGNQLQMLAHSRHPVLAFMAKKALGMPTSPLGMDLEMAYQHASYCAHCRGGNCSGICDKKVDTKEMPYGPEGWPIMASAKEPAQGERLTAPPWGWVNVYNDDKDIMVTPAWRQQGNQELWDATYQPGPPRIIDAQVFVQPYVQLQPMSMSYSIVNATEDQSFFAKDTSPGFKADHATDHNRVEETAAKVPVAVDHDRTFLGYDCTDPRQLEIVSIQSSEECQVRKPVIREQRVRYELLQKVQYGRIPATKCTMTRNKLPLYCGHYDHQTVATSDIWYGVPMKVSEEQCHSMHQEKIYKVYTYPKTGVKKLWTASLRPNSTNVLSYEAYGETTYESNEIHCLGVEWYSESQERTVFNMIEQRTDKVELGHDELIYDPRSKTLTAYQTQEELPASCHINQGHCVTDQGTWVWTPPTEQDLCQLYHLQTITGVESTIRDGNSIRVIFVDNEKLIRLEVKHALMECGKAIRATNFPDFFLANSIAQDNFFIKRPIGARDVNLADHFKQSQGWLAGHVKATLEDLLQQILKTMCEEEINQQRGKFAQLLTQQQAIMTNGIVSLGEGKFASPAGEAWAVYKCRPVLVQGLDEDNCYDGLPVRLGTEYEGLLRDQAINDTVYLAPGSHLIYPQGLQLPCVNQFARHYRNHFGKWMSSSPAIMPANTPKRLQVSASTEGVKVTMNDADWAHAGVYSRKTLDKMAMASLLPRKVKITGYHLTTGSKEGTTSISSPGDTYQRIGAELGVPEDADLGALYQIGNIYEKIRDWGYVLSFFVGMYSLFAIGSYVCSAIRVSLFPKPGDEGWKRWGRACLPSLTDLIEAVLGRGEQQQEEGGDDHQGGGGAHDPAPVNIQRQPRIDECLEDRNLSGSQGESQNFSRAIDHAQLRVMLREIVSQELSQPRTAATRPANDRELIAQAAQQTGRVVANKSRKISYDRAHWSLTPSLQEGAASAAWLSNDPLGSDAPAPDVQPAHQPRSSVRWSGLGLKKELSVNPSAPPASSPGDSGVENPIYETPRLLNVAGEAQVGQDATLDEPGAQHQVGQEGTQEGPQGGPGAVLGSSSQGTPAKESTATEAEGSDGRTERKRLRWAGAPRLASLLESKAGPTDTTDQEHHGPAHQQVLRRRTGWWSATTATEMPATTTTTMRTRTTAESLTHNLQEKRGLTVSSEHLRDWNVSREEGGWRENGESSSGGRSATLPPLPAPRTRKKAAPAVPNGIPPLLMMGPVATQGATQQELEPRPDEDLGNEGDNEEGFGYPRLK